MANIPWYQQYGELQEQVIGLKENTATLPQGTIVKLLGTETVSGVPDVNAIAAATDVPFGVLYEDIKTLKQGICVVAGFVKVLVSADVTQGGWAGIGANGKAADLTFVVKNGVLGIFVGGAGTDADGDLVEVLISLGIASA